jgi:hydrogenase nickel incorporation protein HypB
MCGICGCDDHQDHEHADGTRHSHPHSHDHDPHHPQGHVELETRILAKNDTLADLNRAWLASRGVLAVNLMGAPGCGKTSLLERTIRALEPGSVAVIEGDQATAHDAERVRAAGAAAVQVNTGTGCHLDAGMVARGLEELAPPAGSLVIIENVGNLVCPALFQLGEQRRVVVLSVTEGDDKPLKYPHMFRAADLVLINKIDLLPHVDFGVERAILNARSVNPNAAALQVCAKTGEGLQAWCRWLRDALEGLGDRGERRVQAPGHALGLER